MGSPAPGTWTSLSPRARAALRARLPSLTRAFLACTCRDEAACRVYPSVTGNDIGIISGIKIRHWGHSRDVVDDDDDDMPPLEPNDPSGYA